MDKPSAIRRYSETAKSFLNNQDSMQKVNVGFTLLMELYRVLMGALLVSFVPQKCGDHICSPTENLYVGDGLYTAGFVVNFLTLAAFVSLYVIEVKRENRLITYLEVDARNANDSESVGEALLQLPAEKRENILHLDKLYQRGGYFVTGAFFVNSVLSAVVVFDKYLDSKTATAYITNVLFMASKINSVYTIANTERNVFYSAYLSHKLQYNGVDPDKVNVDVSIHGDIEAMAKSAEEMNEPMTELVDLIDNICDSGNNCSPYEHIGEVEFTMQEDDDHSSESSLSSF
jgi:hypothetical protein